MLEEAGVTEDALFETDELEFEELEEELEEEVEQSWKYQRWT